MQSQRSGYWTKCWWGVRSRPWYSSELSRTSHVLRSSTDALHRPLRVGVPLQDSVHSGSPTRSGPSSGVPNRPGGGGGQKKLSDRGGRGSEAYFLRRPPDHGLALGTRHQDFATGTLPARAGTSGAGRTTEYDGRTGVRSISDQRPWRRDLTRAPLAGRDRGTPPSTQERKDQRERTPAWPSSARHRQRKSEPDSRTSKSSPGSEAPCSAGTAPGTGSKELNLFLFSRA